MKGSRWLQLYLLTLICLTLIGCVTSQQSLERDAQRFSEISVLNPNFRPRPGQTFAWYAPIIWSSEVLEETPELRQSLTQLVEQQIRQKGYQMTEDQQAADYIIGAAIVDSDTASSEQLHQFFRLFPSLGRSSSGAKEAEALIGVIRPRDLDRVAELDNGANIALWRASVKAFVLGDRITPDVRMQRFRALAAKLMESLP